MNSTSPSCGSVDAKVTKTSKALRGGLFERGAQSVGSLGPEQEISTLKWHSTRPIAGPVHSVPAWFFAGALDAHLAAKQAWETLTPSLRKEILRYFARLKSSDARGGICNWRFASCRVGKHVSWHGPGMSGKVHDADGTTGQVHSGPGGRLFRSGSRVLIEVAAEDAEQRAARGTRVPAAAGPMAVAVEQSR